MNSARSSFQSIEEVDEDVISEEDEVFEESHSKNEEHSFSSEDVIQVSDSKDSAIDNNLATEQELTEDSSREEFTEDIGRKGDSLDEENSEPENIFKSFENSAELSENYVEDLQVGELNLEDKIEVNDQVDVVVNAGEYPIEILPSQILDKLVLENVREIENLELDRKDNPEVDRINHSERIEFYASNDVQRDPEEKVLFGEENNDFDGVQCDKEDKIPTVEIELKDDVHCIDEHQRTLDDVDSVQCDKEDQIPTIEIELKNEIPVSCTDAHQGTLDNQICLEKVCEMTEVDIKQDNRKCTKNTGKYRYVKRKVKTKPSFSDESTEISSGRDVRKLVFNSWYLKRLRNGEKNLRINRINKKEQEKLKVKMKEEKKENGMSAFKAWKEKKKEIDVNIKREIISKKKKVREDLEEKVERKIDAEKVYKSWKKIKDESTKKVKKNTKESENSRREKRIIAEKTFNSWLENVNKKLKEERSQGQLKTRRIEAKESANKKRRDKEALKAYRLWIETKYPNKL